MSISVDSNHSSILESKTSAQTVMSWLKTPMRWIRECYWEMSHLTSQASWEDPMQGDNPRFWGKRLNLESRQMGVSSFHSICHSQIRAQGTRFLKSLAFSISLEKLQFLRLTRLSRTLKETYRPLLGQMSCLLSVFKILLRLQDGRIWDSV